MSDSFATALKKTFDQKTVLSQNGAVMYATSGSKLVDLNFAVSSLRSKTESEVTKMFSEAFYENKEYALRWMFYLRDVRGGLGERKTFRWMLKWLAENDTDDAKKLISLLGEYGRYDDLLCLLGTAVEADAIKFIDDQISADTTAMKSGKNVSLLAKWLPSCNTSSPATRANAKKIYTALDLNEKQYRKLLSSLRKHIDVVEVKMSDCLIETDGHAVKKTHPGWSQIDYEHVPSLANIRYKNAFLKHDTERRQKYLEKLSKGEAKINASACFPSDIAYQYLKNDMYNPKPDTVIESMWKALPQIAVEGKNVITVLDVSGSMTWVTCDPKSGLRPLDVALGLGVYCSEHLTGPFKDKCITFSTTPEYVDLSNRTTLADKLSALCTSNVGGSTDVKKVMDLILKTAVANKCKQEEIPTVVIMSDMQFNAGSYYSSGFDADQTALFKEIEAEYKAAGYELPKMFYWNLAASISGGTPLQSSPSGIGLVSGYSQNIVKMLLSDRLDPWEILKEQLDAPRYAAVSNALLKS